MRVVVVGASSGLGRCIGIGLGQRGEDVALLARRRDRLERAAAEAGDRAVAIECDVTDDKLAAKAIHEAAAALGGIDALVYTAAVGPLAPLEHTDAATWQRVFGTNVIGASLVTAAALPYLTKGAGRAIYLSSVISFLTPSWPGLGAYAVSKAALDKLVEAWRMEHPEVGFTRLTVGDCAGGEGDSMTGFVEGWDADLAMKLHPIWASRQYLSGTLFDVEDLVATVHALLQHGPTAAVPSVILLPRTPALDQIS